MEDRRFTKSTFNTWLFNQTIRGKNRVTDNTTLYDCILHVRMVALYMIQSLLKYCR